MFLLSEEARRKLSQQPSLLLGQTGTSQDGPLASVNGSEEATLSRKNSWEVLSQALSSSWHTGTWLLQASRVSVCVFQAPHLKHKGQHKNAPPLSDSPCPPRRAAANSMGQKTKMTRVRQPESRK